LRCWRSASKRRRAHPAGFLGAAMGILAGKRHMPPMSFSEVELEQILAAAALLPPERQAELMWRIARASAHCEYCEEGAVERAIALAARIMTAA
jgi:hypothetical protein